tara:strand:- start:1 stop:591 length:591 start_codon:yes stop_codon:yes gene_type:complete
VAAEPPPPREQDAATADSILFTTASGSFRLRRFPARKREPLLAWCGADTLLAEAACARDESADATLVVNDAHGALSVALEPRAVWTDSTLSAQAIAQNAARNLLPVPQILASMMSPPADVRLIVLRIPRQLPYLRYQLSVLAGRVAAGTTLLAAGMDKHLSPHTAAVIESLFGPVQRHPGRLKVSAPASAPFHPGR